MSYTFKGTVILIEETATIQTKSGTPFTKRNIVVEEQERYNQETGDKYPSAYAQFELSGERCKEADMFQKGDKVEVSFVLAGRMYNDRNTGAERCFNSLRALSIKPIGEMTTHRVEQQQMYPELQNTTRNATTQSVEVQDLPF